eukprot:1158416-Pelagomonas_calceolata.AAC.2
MDVSYDLLQKRVQSGKEGGSQAAPSQRQPTLRKPCKEASAADGSRAKLQDLRILSLYEGVA